MKKNIFLLTLSFTMMVNFATAQELFDIFGRSATDVYVNERFTNPGQFGTIPLAGPYYPIPNIITNNALGMLGGDFNAAGTLYSFVYVNPDYYLVTVDINTGVATTVAIVSGVVASQFLIQLSYNFTNDTFYALSNDPNNNSGTQLYSVNISTALLTPIGTGTGILNGVAMEIDNNGNVYVADANTANLYIVDINSGVGAVVGQMLPFSLYPVRSGMSIDHSDNTMYGVFPNRDGIIRSAFYSINLATGAATNLGDGSSRQYSLFAIPGNILGVGENNLKSLSIYPNPASKVIKIDNPNGLELKNVKLYDMLGRNTVVTVSNGEINIEKLAKGMYILQLQTENGTTTKKILKE